jgi:alanyl-tRNA synthetase
VVEGLNPKDLKGLVDEAKTQLGSGVVVLINKGEDNKAAVVVGVTQDLTKRVSAVDLVRIAADKLGGKGGGGRPDMAQAGGSDASQADAAIDAVEAGLEETLASAGA